MPLPGGANRSPGAGVGVETRARDATDVVLVLVVVVVGGCGGGFGAGAGASGGHDTVGACAAPATTGATSWPPMRGGALELTNIK